MISHRLQAAIEGARKGELWIDLSNGPLQIAKTKKVRVDATTFCMAFPGTFLLIFPSPIQLLEALKSNDSVTSVNLTNCCLNDESAQVRVNGCMGSQYHNHESMTDPLRYDWFEGSRHTYVMDTYICMILSLSCLCRPLLHPLP